MKKLNANAGGIAAHKHHHGESASEASSITESVKDKLQNYLQGVNEKIKIDTKADKFQAGIEKKCADKKSTLFEAVIILDMV